MNQITTAKLVTFRCFDAEFSFQSYQIGKYFSYVAGSSFPSFFPAVFSVVDDFGNLVPVL